MPLFEIARATKITQITNFVALSSIIIIYKAAVKSRELLYPVNVNSHVLLQGRIQDFNLGGGAQKIMRERTLRARNLKSLLAGIQGPLKGPGSSRGF